MGDNKCVRRKWWVFSFYQCSVGFSSIHNQKECEFFRVDPLWGWCRYLKSSMTCTCREARTR